MKNLPTFLRVTVLLHVMVFTGCWALFHPSYDYSEVSTKRIPDQTYYADSVNVFFVEYTNPYPDKEVLWFSSFIEGDVAMEIHSTETDSVVAIFRFEPQEAPLFAVAYRADSERLVKCVVRINGRQKCARLLPSFYPLPQPQWGTVYHVEVVE